MNIDPVLAQFIITAIVAIPVYFKMRAELRKSMAETDRSNVQDSLDLKREYKADLSALEVKYDALLVKYDLLRGDFQQERASRSSDKAAHEDEIHKVRVELQHALAVQGLLENSLIEAQQRISALEDERDLHVSELARKDARIAELEKISGTFPAVKP